MWAFDLSGLLDVCPWYPTTTISLWDARDNRGRTEINVVQAKDRSVVAWRNRLGFVACRSISGETRVVSGGSEENSVPLTHISILSSQMDKQPVSSYVVTVSFLCGICSK